MRHLIALVFIALLPTAAHATGFAHRDLTRIEAAAKAVLGQDFSARSTPEQLVIGCETCADGAMIGVTVGRQADATERDIRSGATTIHDLEKLCRARAPECTLTAVAVDPAVGWVTAYRIGDTAGATAVLLRDGDLLTIRSLANSATAARAHIDALLPLIRSRVIG